LGFYALAMTSQGLIPYLEKSLTRPETVRNMGGQVVATPHRSAVEDVGRKVYIREGCWYCHSQFVRPVNRDTDKWGPVSQAGEFIYDVPQMFGTRRIGPDLSREGNRRSDEWHYAHHWNPRAVEPESMMPAYSWLFTEDTQHDRAVTAFIETYDKNHDGRVTKSELDAIAQKPANFAELDTWPVNADGSHGDGIIDMHDYGPVPSEEMVGVEAYMQRLEPPSAIGGPGKPGRRRAARPPTSRSRFAKAAVRPFSRPSAPAATARTAMAVPPRIPPSRPISIRRTIFSIRSRVISRQRPSRAARRRPVRCRRTRTSSAPFLAAYARARSCPPGAMRRTVTSFRNRTVGTWSTT